MKESLLFGISGLIAASSDVAAGRFRKAFAHPSKLTLLALAAGALLVIGLPLVDSAQLPGPNIPGSPVPKSPTLPSPNINPIGKKLVADPFTFSMQPAGNGPFYMPGISNCPAQTLRFDSVGGYAPITWSHSGSILGMEKNQLGSSIFELVDPSGQTATSPAPGTVPLKPASPSTRLVRYAGTWAGGGVPGFSLATRLTVMAVDGSGQKRGNTFEIRPTRACGAPVLSGASLATGGATTNALASQMTYTLQIVNFDTRDNSDPTRTRETRVECGYPSGLRVDCLDGLRYTGQLGSESDHCLFSTSCRIRVQNLEGSGSVAVRLRNPYGVSAVLLLNATFPSAVLTENETFALPPAIAKDAVVVTGSPDVSDYIGEAAPTCPNSYLVWRGLTYSDPTGRSTLERPVKPGARVAPSTMPQWKIAPGSTQITFQVSYEVERRNALCQALVVQ